MNPLISIIIATNKAKNIIGFFENIETTLFDPNACEILLKTDIEDENLVEIIAEEKKKRPYTIKHICTPKRDGYWSLWESYNQLAKLSSENSYFTMALNDECRFGTQYWDQILATYKKSFPDDIFHLRLSPRKDYLFKSLIEAIPFGESFGIFTKKWIELTEGINIGQAGSDTGQECVNYFLREYYSENRGITVENIEMLNQDESISASHGLSDSEWVIKSRRINENYSKFISLPQCENFLRLSTKLNAYIKNHKQDDDEPLIECEPSEKTVNSFTTAGELTSSHSYKIDFNEWLKILFEIELVTNLHPDFSRWPPLLSNQLVARLILAQEISKTTPEAFNSYFEGQVVTNFNKIRSIASISSPLSDFERHEISPLVESLLKDNDLEDEQTVIKKVLNKLLSKNVTVPDLFAASLYITNVEFASIGIQFPPQEYKRSPQT